MSNILEIRDLKVWFPVRKGVFSRVAGYIKAVDGVSFDLEEGQTLGVVGESGSGKSTVARTIAGLVKPTAGTFSLKARLGMVFQDPLGSLNPRQTVREAVGTVPRGFRRPDVAALVKSVGLDSAVLDRYPHEFSGGERQRICIARALAVEPRLLVCDEAVSALDLSVRAQVLDLLVDLKRQLGLSYLFITHDLGVVQHVSDAIVVMRRGKVVESGSAESVLHSPSCEYTRNLLAAVPRIKAR